LGATNARRRKDRCRHCYESGNTVSICTFRLKIVLTSSKSRGYINYSFYIHPEFGSTGCIM
jgi:hypothetical protein